MTPLSVGVVGTGAMGLGVVRSLTRHAVPTITRDVSDAANASARALGATPMPSAAAVADAADIVIVLVVDDSQIDDVLFGANGAATAFRPNSVLVVSSTVDPVYVAALPARLGEAVSVVDAPVSGGPAKAADGTMTMMISGERAAVARCGSVLPLIAGRVFDVGNTPGQAATFKIVNNLLAAANLAAGAEALALASRAGIDPRAVLEVINASSGASWIVTDRMQRALAGDTGVRAAARILAKDVGIAERLSQRLGVDAPCTRTALQVFEAAVAAGHGEADDSVLLEHYLRRMRAPDRRVASTPPQASD